MKYPGYLRSAYGHAGLQAVDSVYVVGNKVTDKASLLR